MAVLGGYSIPFATQGRFWNPPLQCEVTLDHTQFCEVTALSRVLRIAKRIWASIGPSHGNGAIIVGMIGARAHLKITAPRPTDVGVGAHDRDIKETR